MGMACRSFHFTGDGGSVSPTCFDGMCPVFNLDLMGSNFASPATMSSVRAGILTWSTVWTTPMVPTCLCTRCGGEHFDDDDGELGRFRCWCGRHVILCQGVLVDLGRYVYIRKKPISSLTLIFCQDCGSLQGGAFACL
jgi:hypothetical protein